MIGVGLFNCPGWLRNRFAVPNSAGREREFAEVGTASDLAGLLPKLSVFSYYSQARNQLPSRFEVRAMMIEIWHWIAYSTAGHWVAFSTLVTVLLLLDLFVFHRHDHSPLLLESAGWSLFWSFGAGVQRLDLVVVGQHPPWNT